MAKKPFISDVSPVDTREHIQQTEGVVENNITPSIPKLVYKEQNNDVPTPNDPNTSPNPFLRCTLPGISSIDSLRQFLIPGVRTSRFMPRQ